jgi:predicted RNA-binding Zn-ribbon protein involved in translation (DUF1610 family)
MFILQRVPRVAEPDTFPAPAAGPEHCTWCDGEFMRPVWDLREMAWNFHCPSCGNPT